MKREGGVFVGVVLILLAAPPTLAQVTCPAPDAIILTDFQLQDHFEKYPGCTQVLGDLVMGTQDCSAMCSVSQLPLLTGIQRFNGSLRIQCCNSLTDLTSFSSLSDVTGSLVLYYNSGISQLTGFQELQTVRGSVSISQNQNLARITGFSSLTSISGHLSIERNAELVSIEGFRMLRSLGGSDTLSGHALSVLYNMNLLSLSGLAALTTLSYGTVHIEGNTALCYAGYPLWGFGSYPIRRGDGDADKGIDWRTRLPGEEAWQFTWGVEGGGYPSLVIQNNAPSGTCGAASCHTSCPTNAGCLGPNDPALCGSCDLIGTFDPCEVVSGTTSSASSTPVILGVVLAVVAIVILVLVGLGMWLCVVCGRKWRENKKGSFDINLSGDVEATDFVPQKKNCHTSQSSQSGLIASYSVSENTAAIGAYNNNNNNNKRMTKSNSSSNNVTMSSYRPANGGDTVPAALLSQQQQQERGQEETEDDEFNSAAFALPSSDTQQLTTTSVTTNSGPHITPSASSSAAPTSNDSSQERHTAAHKHASTTSPSQHTTTTTTTSENTSKDNTRKMRHETSSKRHLLEASLQDDDEEEEDEDGMEGYYNPRAGLPGDEDQLGGDHTPSSTSANAGVAQVRERRLAPNGAAVAGQSSKGQSSTEQSTREESAKVAANDSPPQSTAVMNFPKEQVKLGKELGVGDFGKVLQGEARKLLPGQKKTTVVIKQLKLGATAEEREAFLRPVEAMKLLQHPNVLSLMGVVNQGPSLMAMLEYCSLGNLKTFLVTKRKEAALLKKSSQFKKMAVDMAAGLCYLHSKSIAHNDFAARSCLVTGEGSVKLGDYGITRQTFKEDYYSRGHGQKAWPIRWMAPEQVVTEDKNHLDSIPVSLQANLWSFGVALWELCSFARWPYDEMSNEEVVQTVISSGKCLLENPLEPNDSMTYLFDICELCWTEPSLRPTMEELVAMIKDPTLYKKKKRTSSLTRQKMVSVQSKSATLPSPRRAPLSPAKSAGEAVPQSTKRVSISVTVPITSGDKDTPSGKPSATSSSGSASTVTEYSSNSLKPRRPAPVKPVKRAPAPPRPAPARPAPVKPVSKETQPVKHTSDSKEPLDSGGPKSADNGKGQESKVQQNVTSKPTAFPPSAMNLGFELPEDDNELPAMEDVDIDESMFSGGAEGEPPADANDDSDFILEPPERFSQSSLDQLSLDAEDIPALAKPQGDSLVMEFQPPTISDDEEVETNFIEEPPPEASKKDRDGEEDVKTGESLKGSRARRRRREDGGKSGEDEDGIAVGVKNDEDEVAKAKKKKKKKRKSKDYSSSTKERDPTKHKSKKRKSSSQQNLSSKSQSDLMSSDSYHYNMEDDDIPPAAAEYEFDRGLDRIPMKSSQESYSITQPPHTASSQTGSGDHGYLDKKKSSSSSHIMTTGFGGGSYGMPSEEKSLSSYKDKALSQQKTKRTSEEESSLSYSSRPYKPKETSSSYHQATSKNTPGKLGRYSSEKSLLHTETASKSQQNSSKKTQDTSAFGLYLMSKRAQSHDTLLDSREEVEAGKKNEKKQKDLRSGSNYEDVSASDDYNPPWLEDDEEDMGAEFKGQGDDDPVPVYTEEVAALLW